MARAPKRRAIAENRKARHDYTIVETIEAGLCLLGSEVKALREGRANLVDAHAGPRTGEIFLMESYIGPHSHSHHKNAHMEKRPRKILLSKREINRYKAMLKQKNMTLVPLSIYFNKRGIAKVELALAQGRRKHDKRAVLKERDWKKKRARMVGRNVVPTKV